MGEWEKKKQGRKTKAPATEASASISLEKSMNIICGTV